MAGDKQTIESFSIDLLLNSPKFLQQLQSVEKRVNEAAQRMEKRLASAFNLRGKGAVYIQKDLNRIIKATEVASKHINRNLTQAFNVRGNNSNFRQWVSNAERSAERVTSAIDRANRRMGANGGARIGGGGSAGGSERLSSEQRLARQYQNRIARQADSVHAQMFGSTLERLRRGGHTEQANNFRNQIRDSYVRNRGNADPSVFRREIREIVSANRSFLNAQRSSSQSLASVGNAASGLTSNLGSLAAGVLSVQAALEYFKASLLEGQKRTQARVMLGAAYGSDQGAITQQVNTYADKFGMDKAEAQQQAAILRQTLPASLFSNTDIPKLMQTESIFGHQTGMSNEAIGRLNYVLPQIAASSHLMMQDWMQVSNAAPAITRPLMELTGTKNIAELKAKAKTMSGAEFAKLMVQAMETLANNADVAAAAMNSMQANIGRYQNAVKDGQEAFFDGYSDGFKNLLGSMVVLFEHSTGTLKTTGEILGGIFNDVAEMVTGLTNSFIHARGYTLQFLDVMNEGFSALPKKAQDALGDIGDLAVKGTVGFIAFKVFTNIFKMFGIIRNVAAAATTTAEVATVAVSRMGMLTGFLKAFRLGPLAEFLLLVELAGNASAMINSANTLRGKMGLDNTRGFSERAHSDDAAWYDKLLGYNPDELFTWFKGGISDSPIMNGNWTGATAPNGITPYVPNVNPLLTPAQGMKGEVTVKVEGANGQIIGQATLNQNNRYQAAIRGSMTDPWSDASPNVPLTRPVQQ